MQPRSKTIILTVAVVGTCAVIVSVSVFLVTMPLKKQNSMNEIKLVIQQAEIDFYKQFTNETLRNPSYLELRLFLQNDSTDEHPYINGEYVCLDFSYTLIRNATSYGFLCRYARVGYGIFSTGHAMVTFDTTDAGLVFIESQK